MLKNKKLIIFISLVIIAIIIILGLYTNKNQNNISTTTEPYNTNASYQDALKLMHNVKFDLFSDKQDKLYCNTLLNDFKTNKNIQLIEPTIVTNDYEDKKLTSYFKKCPKLMMKLHTLTDYPPGQEEAMKELPLDIRKQHELTYYITLGFRLYDLDFDSNPINGKQNIFYSGGLYNKKYDFCANYDYFIVIDINKCQDLGRAKATPLGNCKNKESTGNYNGIIKYKNKSLASGKSF